MTLGHSGEAVLQPLPQLVMGETSGYTSEDEVSPSPTSVSLPSAGNGGSRVNQSGQSQEPQSQGPGSRGTAALSSPRHPRMGIHIAGLSPCFQPLLQLPHQCSHLPVGALSRSGLRTERGGRRSVTMALPRRWGAVGQPTFPKERDA